ncbi:complement receptor type 1 [Nematolebias whitei]|uniref:complement receptor type 1 n=1 Tax=Nematolebias whitei TaxID=451745 RepID=UPI00189BE838|nr:complement receptor type 1 [Nematolebias whitei]
MKTDSAALLLLPFTLLAAAQGAQRCSSPPQYPRTELLQRFTSKQSFDSGDKVYYNCAQDFTPSGGIRSSRCLDGKWSKLTLTCAKIFCGNAGELPNGKFLYEKETYIGEKLHAVCNEGYALKGLDYMVCNRSGWSGEFPSCEKAETTCSPPAVANSEPQSETPVHHVGVSVNVTCKQGFQLNGASLITCGANGQWQPQPPQCLHRLVKFQLLSIVAKDGCGAPPPPPVSHSNVHLSNKYITMTSFPSGAKVYYKCNAGYATEGGSRSRVCSDGKWTPLTLKCEAKSCGHPGQILNGQFEYSGGIVFGATATAVCDDGYTLVGRGIRRCTSNGWDGRVPVCEAVECEEPEKTDAERKTFQEPPYTYRSVIRYDCREKTLVGEREIWCTKDGTWSSSPPQCRDVTCPSPNIPNAFWVNAHRQTYRPRDTIDSFECRRGFKLSGSKFIICNDEGQWEPKLPSCQLQRQPQASSYRVRGWYNGRG